MRRERGEQLDQRLDLGAVRHALVATEDEIERAVQVNGKLRGTVRVARDIAQDQAPATALAGPSIAKFVTGSTRKVIFVPGRLLNLVV